MPVRGTEDVAAPGIVGLVHLSVSSPSLSMPRRRQEMTWGMAEVGNCCWGKWVQSCAPSLGFRVLLAAISLLLPSISCVSLHLSLSCQPVLRHIPKYLSIMFEMADTQPQGERCHPEGAGSSEGPSWSPEPSDWQGCGAICHPQPQNMLRIGEATSGFLGSPGWRQLLPRGQAAGGAGNLGRQGPESRCWIQHLLALVS